MDERLKQLLVVGREHYARREFDKAEPVLRQILEQDDRFADIHDMLGVIAHLRGNLIAAEHHFERALAINPGYTEAALNLAVTLNDRGKYQAAREIYKRIRGASGHGAPSMDAFARGKIANMHADVGQAYADLGMVREAAAEFEKAVALCPEFADLRTRLGALLYEQGDVVAARRQYEAAVTARPSFHPARLQLGVALLAQGDDDGAEREWRRVLESEPEDARAKMHLRALALQRESGLFKAASGSGAPPPNAGGSSPPPPPAPPASR